MTKDEVRAAAERLVEFHERFAPLFSKEQAQDNAYCYVKGLMVCPERKSIEPIALNVGNGNVSALEKFINIAPWALSGNKLDNPLRGDGVVPLPVKAVPRDSHPCQFVVRDFDPL